MVLPGSSSVFSIPKRNKIRIENKDADHYHRMPHELAGDDGLHDHMASRIKPITWEDVTR